MQLNSLSEIASYMFQMVRAYWLQMRVIQHVQNALIQLG